MRRRCELVPAMLYLVGVIGCGSSHGKRVDGSADVADAGAQGDFAVEMAAGVDAGQRPPDAPDVPSAEALDTAVGTPDAPVVLDSAAAYEAGRAPDLATALDLSSEAGAPDLVVKPIEKVYVCGELLSDSAKLLNLWRDPWTGLPYDNIPCGGPFAADSASVNPAWGVVPQLAFADLSAFSEDASRTDATVAWSFADRAPDDTLPSLLWALKIALQLDDGNEAGVANRYGGLLWHAYADVSRYAQVRIRYRTSDATSDWQFKLNFGTTSTVEPAVILAGSTEWTDRTFTIATDFPGADAAHLNFLTFASSVAASGANPTIWIDQVSFVSDSTRLADCDVACPSTLPPYPDLACYEPQTGAVNIANALTFLSTAPAAALLDEVTAKEGATRILASMESFPGARATTRANGQPYAGGGWYQDWHSPASMMPNPRNRAASLTDQPQLYAALMVVESTWPDLTLRAQALRNKMDFSVLYDDRYGCPGTLLPGIDRCAGFYADWTVDRFGTDYLLGAFLAEATGAAPLCFWTTGLARSGCALVGPADAPWYGAGGLCANAAIPASDSGGPFLQLAGLLYLASDQIPMGSLSLGASAQNMLRAQYRFAADNDLVLAGWASASDPDACSYTTCPGFVPDKVTPYVSGMAASDQLPESYRMLRAFHLLGADAQLATGGDGISLGLRDSWNLTTAIARASYLYLDTGWMELGLLNACKGDVVRQRFGQHAVA
ncbi:MAG TPA: hypothetical protein VF550_09190, partial [Polyangia bacterium]